MASGGAMGGAIDTLYVELEARTGRLEAQLDQLGQSAQNQGRRAGGLFSGAFAVGLGNLISSGVQSAMASISSFMKDSFKGVQDDQESLAQLEAVIKSTGNTAGVSTDALNAMALSIQGTTKFTANAVNAAQSMLLTFTNIKAQGGVFDEATRTAMDMAQALGGDAKQQALQLGKALNDPIKGIAALTRVGVTFTAQQKEQIKAMVASGNTMGAQKLILAELNKEFGGSAEAAGKTFPGQMERARNALGEIGKAIAIQVMPYLQQFMDVILRNMPQIQASVQRAMGVVSEVFGFVARSVFPVVQRAMTDLMPVFTRVSASVGGFGDSARSVLPIIGPMVMRLWAQVQPLLAALGPLFAAAFEYARLAWERVLKPTLIAMAPLFEGVFGAVIRIVTGAVQVVTGIVQALTRFLKGDFEGAGQAIQRVFYNLLKAVALALESLAMGVIRTLSNLARVMLQAGQNMINNLVAGIQSRAAGAINAAIDVANGIREKLGMEKLAHVAGQKTTVAFALGVVSNTEVAKAAVAKMTADAANISTTNNAAYRAGERAASSVAEGITAGAPVVSKAVQKLNDVVNLDKFKASLKGMSRSELDALMKTAMDTGDLKKYSALKAEIARQEKAHESALKKTAKAADSHADSIKKNREQLEKSIAQDAFVRSLEKMSAAQLGQLQTQARAAGSAERYNAVKSELERRENAHTAAVKKNADALNDAAKKIADWKKSIGEGQALDRYAQSLKGMTAAQLASQLQMNFNTASAERYNAVKSEMERREREHTDAIKKNADEQKRQAEQLANWQKGIRDDQALNRFQNSLSALSDTQLKQAEQTAFNTGASSRYNAIIAEQQRRVTAARDAWRSYLDTQVEVGKRTQDAISRGAGGAQAGLPSNMARLSLGDLQAQINALNPDQVDGFRRSVEQLHARQQLLPGAFDQINTALDAHLARFDDLRSIIDDVSEGLDEFLAVYGKVSQLEMLPQRRLDLVTGAAAEALPGRTNRFDPSTQETSPFTRGQTPIAASELDAFEKRVSAVIDAAHERTLAWEQNMQRLDFQGWTNNLRQLSDEQFQAAMNTAVTTQNVAQYNALLSEQSRRADEAVEANRRLQEAETRRLEEAARAAEYARGAFGRMVQGLSDLIGVGAGFLQGAASNDTERRNLGAASQMAQGFAQIVTSGGNLMGMFQGFSTLLQPLLAELAPILQPIIAAFSELFEALRPVVTFIARILSPVFQVLGAIITGLARAIAFVVRIITFGAVDLNKDLNGPQIPNTSTGTGATSSGGGGGSINLAMYNTFALGGSLSDPAFRAQLEQMQRSTALGLLRDVGLIRDVPAGI